VNESLWAIWGRLLEESMQILSRGRSSDFKLKTEARQTLTVS
jgi:hypothetical protein